MCDVSNPGFHGPLARWSAATSNVLPPARLASTIASVRSWWKKPQTKSSGASWLGQTALLGMRCPVCVSIHLFNACGDIGIAPRLVRGTEGRDDSNNLVGESPCKNGDLIGGVLFDPVA